MTHGLSGVKEQRLDAYAETFCRSGVAVLVYDHRNLGASDGEPRQLVNPWAQTRDMRRAVEWLGADPHVDPRRIGLWGTSLSGGEVIVLAALDDRVRAVIANVPFVGYGPGGGDDDPLDAMARVFDDATGTGPADAGEIVGPLRLIDDGDDGDVLFPEPAAREFFTAGSTTTWRNSIHVQSAFTDPPLWNPGLAMPYLTVPTLVVVAAHDEAAPPQVAIDALSGAQGPTRLETFDCGHFDVYDGEHFERASDAMTAFLAEHLR